MQPALARMVRPSTRAESPPKRPTIRFVDMQRRTATRPTTAISRFVPPLALPEDTIERLETGKRPASSSVRDVLNRKGEMSTPRSIQTFVITHDNEAKYIDSAIVVQRAWRRYKSKMKMKSFLQFVMKARFRKVCFGFHLWRLTQMSPGDVAQKSYDAVIHYLSVNGLIVEQEDGWCTADMGMRILDFEHYMRIGMLAIPVDVRASVLVQFRKLIYKRLVVRCVRKWAELAAEKAVLAKTDPGVIYLANARGVFQGEYSGFVFWRFWTKYRKTKAVERGTWVPECRWFMAKKRTARRLNSQADDQRRMFIKKSVLRFMYLSHVAAAAQRSRTKLATKFHNRRLMVISFKRFQQIGSKRSVNRNRVRRCLREWYKLIDWGIITQMKGTVIRQRDEIQTMQNFFTQWRQILVTEAMRMTYLHELVTANNIFCMRIVLLMMGDFVHYAFYTGFQKWRELLRMKNKKLRFVQWSLHNAQGYAVARFLIDVFKENAGIVSRRINYLPFRRDGEKGFLLMRTGEASKLSTKARRKNRLLRTLKEGTEGYVMRVFGTTVDETMNAAKNVNSYPEAESDWYKNATREQIRTLFYRLVIVMANRSTLKRKIGTSKEKAAKLGNFRSSKLIFSRLDLAGFRHAQDTKDLKVRKQLQRRFQQDAERLMALETHDAAIALSKHVKQFTLNDNLTELSSGRYADDGTTPSPTRSRAKRHSIRPRFGLFNHPMLQDIEVLRDKIEEVNRMYRRRPNDVFMTEAPGTVRSTTATTSVTTEILPRRRIRQEDAFIYEPFKTSWKLGDRRSESRQSLSAFQLLQRSHLSLLRDGDDTYSQLTESFSQFERSREEVVPPRFEDLPSTLSLPSQLSLDPGIELRRSLTQSSQYLLSSTESFSRLALKDQKLLTDTLERLETISEAISTNEEEESHEVSIEKLASHFVQDPSFYETCSDQERVNMMTTKYFTVLDILLEKASRRSKPPDLIAASRKPARAQFPVEELHSHITKYLRKITPPAKPKAPKPQPVKAKKEPEKQPRLRSRTLLQSKNPKDRKRLFQDPDEQFEEVEGPNGEKYRKSACPEFNKVLFNGNVILTQTLIPQNSENKEDAKAQQEEMETETDEYSIDEEGLYRKPQSKKKQSPRLQAPKLQAPKLQMPAFANIPGGEKLMKKLESYLNSNITTLEEHEAAMESLRKTAMEATSDEMKTITIRFLDIIAKKYLLMQTDKEKKDLNQLVVLAEAETSSTSEEENEVSTIPIRKAIFTTAPEKKYAAFGTSGRQREPKGIEVLHRELTFTKDLADAINDASRYTRPYVIRYYERLSDIKPFEGLTRLKRTVRKLLRPPPEEPVEEPPPTPLTLSLGGVTKRKSPKRIRPSTPNLTPKKKRQPLTPEAPKLQISTRERTPLLDGCLRPEPSRAKTVLMKRPMAGKPKPRFTKMTPTMPNTPSDYYLERPKLPPPQRKPHHFKWNPKQDTYVTDEDIDFFLFVTPYVLPPELLNDLIDDYDDTE